MPTPVATPAAVDSVDREGVDSEVLRGCERLPGYGL